MNSFQSNTNSKDCNYIVNANKNNLSDVLNLLSRRSNKEEIEDILSKKEELLSISNIINNSQICGSFNSFDDISNKILEQQDEDININTLRNNLLEVKNNFKENLLLEDNIKIETKSNLNDSSNLNVNNCDNKLKSEKELLHELENESNILKINNNNLKYFKSICSFKQAYYKACENDKDLKYLSNLSFPFGGINSTLGCTFCLHKKPNRTHHCRYCKQCVLKQDHHCDFISNCIGFKNYKQFVLMLFYLTILNFYILLNSFDSFRYYFNEYEYVVSTTITLIILIF